MRIKSPFLLTLLLGCTMVACQNNRAKVNPPSNDSTLVGNDKDNNGCLASAGYSWSQLKDSCIRPWENSIALHVSDTSANYESAAFVFIDDKQHKAELFLKEEKQSLLLDSIAPLVYANDDYQLKQVDHCWSLIKAQKKLYQEKK